MSSSSSGNKSSSKGNQFWTMNQNVWSGQQPFLKDLYSQAMSRYQNFDPSKFDSVFSDASSFGKGITGSVFPAWNNQLQGGAGSAAAMGTSQSLIDSLNKSLSAPSNTGRMYQSIVGGSGNTYIDPMVDAMKRGTIDSLERQLPQLDAQAVSAGQMGSSRHGIAEGLARSDANKYMADTEAAMRANAYDTDLNWKMDIANLADQNIGMAQDRALSLLDSQNLAQQGAIGAGQTMYDYNNNNIDIANQKMNLPWDVLANYSNIIGSPTVLSNGMGTGSYSGNSKGASKSSSIK